MALANADRCSDLAALEVNRLYRQGNGIRFIVTALTKTRQSGPPREAFYPSFSGNPLLCQVRALEEYVTRTASLRTETSERSPLFIAV